MFASILKFAAKSYFALIALTVMGVFAVFVIFAGLIAFVNLIVPG